MSQDANIMQRVFDALRTDVGISVDEIAKSTRLTPSSIVSALKRLQLQRAMAPASCVDGVWRYKRRPEAIRPSDRRGGLRQMRQEAVG